MSSGPTVTNPRGVVAPEAAAVRPGAVLYVPGTRERPQVREKLARQGWPLTIAADVTDALQRLGDRRFELCVVDLADDRAAVPLIRMMRAQYPNMPVLAIADPANPLIAADAIHSGVADVLPWPFEERDLAVAVSNASDRVSIDLPVTVGGARDQLFSHSPAMRATVELLQSAAGTRGGIALCGEPGSGRQLVARAIHGASARGGDRPFIVVDCAEGSPQDLERRLFGGAGDRRDAGGPEGGLDRLGRQAALVEAARGTLLLRNLVDAPARVQVRLARLLRDREALVGDKRTLVELDARAVSAFDPGIDADVDEGRLRPELFDRFAGIRIDVPSLRRRREDIPLLAVHLLQQLTEAYRTPPRTLSRSAVALLSALPWRGNVPELRGLLEALVRTARRPIIQLDDVLEHAQLDGLTATIDPGVTLRDAKARFERDCITAVLMRHHGRVGEAAKALGIQRTNLYRKVRQLNVARSLLSARK
jgi:two-component system nitrogen regulation response regulator NtrX